MAMGDGGFIVMKIKYVVGHPQLNVLKYLYQCGQLSLVVKY